MRSKRSLALHLRVGALFLNKVNHYSRNFEVLIIIFA